MHPTPGASSSATAAQNVVKPPVVQPAGSGNNIIVNPCQRGNPILECIRNVGKEFGEIVADYQVGRTTGVLFLSLRYHRLHPEYIHQRIERLGHSYHLRILLLMCDISEHQDPIRELTKICLVNNITIMVAWNAEEAGFYLSTYKQYEHKPPDLIKERVDKDYHSILRTALTSISKVNKTDVETLRTSFGSFADIAKTTPEQLQSLPGFGQIKAKRIHDAFAKPFRNKATITVPLASQTEQFAALSSASNHPGTSAATASAGGTRATRDESPLWDIELDLNGSPSPTSETGPPPERSPLTYHEPSTAENKKRPPSPVWDIELDLNDDEQQNEGSDARKKRKTFGSPSIL